MTNLTNAATQEATMATFQSPVNCEKCGHDAWRFVSRKTWCAQCGHKWPTQSASASIAATRLHDMQKAHNAKSAA